MDESFGSYKRYYEACKAVDAHVVTIDTWRALGEPTGPKDKIVTDRELP